jgi:hypothetical protein
MNIQRLGVAAIVVAALGTAAAPALAQQPPKVAPNLVGEWKGTSPGAAVVGGNPYHKGVESNEPHFTDALEFTITISEQKGNRFVGKLSDGKRTEKLVGALSPNNLVGTILDDDGHYVFTIRDRDTLDVCYSHMTPASKVVACFPWTRSKQ